MLFSFMACITAPLYMLGSALYGRIGLRHGDTLHGLDMPSNGYMSPFMPRRLFGLTFAASGALLLLVLLEVYGGVPPSNRWLLWRLHLIFGLAIIVLVLPYMLGSSYFAAFFQFRNSS